MLTNLICIATDMQDKFASMIVDAGFQKVEYENLVGGVVAIARSTCLGRYYIHH